MTSSNELEELTRKYVVISQNDTIYDYILVIKSDNQFEDGTIRFLLGHTVEESIDALISVKNLMLDCPITSYSDATFQKVKINGEFCSIKHFQYAEYKGRKETGVMIDNAVMFVHAKRKGFVGTYCIYLNELNMLIKQLTYRK